jgi:hypothetical protein
MWKALPAPEIAIRWYTYSTFQEKEFIFENCFLFTHEEKKCRNSRQESIIQPPLQIWQLAVVVVTVGAVLQFDAAPVYFSISNTLLKINLLLTEACSNFSIRFCTILVAVNVKRKNNEYQFVKFCTR